MSMKFFTGLQDFLGLYDSAVQSTSSTSPTHIVEAVVSTTSVASVQNHKQCNVGISRQDSDDEPKKRCSHNRNVHFPDDNKLVTSYHDALKHSFDTSEPFSPKLIVDAYISACKRADLSPLSTVEKQTACFHQVCNVRQECFSLKGKRITAAHMECLEEIFKRAQFDYLDFEYTFIDDDAAVCLAEMLEFYESAVKLNLSFNKQISLRGWQSIFKAVKNCDALKLLNLRYTSISERAVPTLARVLRCQPVLTTLHLENVSLSGKNLLLLVCALKTNVVLKELYLGENNLQPVDGAHLYQIIVANTSIQMLDLRNNQLQDCGLRMICDALKHKDIVKKSCLTALVLWNNGFTSDSMDSLASALKENKKLETINIGSNKLSLAGILALKPALLVNRTLQRLGLQATDLDCQAAIVLAECLADNNVMIRLDLRDNLQIGSAGLLALHLAMKMNTSITLLNLDFSCTNSNNSKVKEYHEQFKKYYDEIKCFCDRNRQIALQKLTVTSTIDNDEEKNSLEISEISMNIVDAPPVPSNISSHECKLKESEMLEDERESEKAQGELKKHQPVWKLQRSLSLTCTELVDDISERILQMNSSLVGLNDAVDSSKTIRKSSTVAYPNLLKVELGKSPSLPLLSNLETSVEDKSSSLRKKTRRFSVSSTSLPGDIGRTFPRFKVERVFLPNSSVTSGNMETAFVSNVQPKLYSDISCPGKASDAKMNTIATSSSDEKLRNKAELNGDIIGKSLSEIDEVDVSNKINFLKKQVIASKIASSTEEPTAVVKSSVKDFVEEILKSVCNCSETVSKSLGDVDKDVEKIVDTSVDKEKIDSRKDVGIVLCEVPKEMACESVFLETSVEDVDGIVHCVVKDLVNYISYEMGENYAASEKSHLSCLRRCSSRIKDQSSTLGTVSCSNSIVEEKLNDCDNHVIQSIVRHLIREVLIGEKESLTVNLRKRRRRFKALFI